ncbi:TetR/AcrR family transcriptional regulator [uncultured Corynebacterium sp.]|uniref:TetR/AcrR family transcriptional regulator n=1 Tax=uncultured Corynebacterium sp. TaxID=159447 RepID=UPI0025DE53F0|nr:TetR/AcrR family transcriptional regulator [uncultured Corynebacterium sp.]
MVTTPDSVEVRRTPTRAVAEGGRGPRQDARIRQLLNAAATLMRRSGSDRVSMQAIADEAGISVGLIYRYYENKEALVRAVIIGVLDQMAEEILRALDPVADPVRQLAAAFTAYAQVVRDNRHGILLTYRETHLLDRESQKLIMSREVQTGQPLLQATRDAVGQGIFHGIDSHVFSYDLLVTAQSWAFKHWYFAGRMDFNDFVSGQFALALSGVLRPGYRDRYADLLTTVHTADTTTRQ